MSCFCFAASLILPQVPKECVEKGLKANEWCGGQVQAVIGGKGGGRPENAQAVGTNLAGLENAMKVADEWAKEKLGLAESPVIQPPQEENCK